MEENQSIGIKLALLKNPESDKPKLVNSLIKDYKTKSASKEQKQKIISALQDISFSNLDFHVCDAALSALMKFDKKNTINLLSSRLSNRALPILAREQAGRLLSIYSGPNSLDLFLKIFMQEDDYRIRGDCAYFIEQVLNSEKESGNYTSKLASFEKKALNEFEKLIKTKIYSPIQTSFLHEEHMQKINSGAAMPDSTGKLALLQSDAFSCAISLLENKTKKEAINLAKYIVGHISDYQVQIASAAISKLVDLAGANALTTLKKARESLSSYANLTQSSGSDFYNKNFIYLKLDENINMLEGGRKEFNENRKREKRMEQSIDSFKLLFR
jgi:hypothetical protein